jgi:hypothetical protein
MEHVASAFRVKFFWCIFEVFDFGQFADTELVSYEFGEEKMVFKPELACLFNFDFGWQGVFRLLSIF